MTKRTIDTSLAFLGVCAAGLVLFLPNTANDVQAASNDAAGPEAEKQSYEKLAKASFSGIQEPEEYSLRLSPKPGGKYRYRAIGQGAHRA